MSRRSLFLATLVVSVGTLLSGCLAPTLPLPPPSRPHVTAPDDSGMITISGRVNGGARALVQNQRTSDIVGKRTDDSGRYEVRMEAEAGDQLIVWQSLDTYESDITEVVVPDVDAIDLNSTVEGSAGAAND